MHYFLPFYSPFAPALGAALLPLIIIAALWTMVIKGYALWHAARNGQTAWFIAILVINTLGILELVYLLWFRTRASDTVQKPVEDSSTQA
jgi:hypothetical protein